jgi:hypothetical protein
MSTSSPVISNFSLFPWAAALDPAAAEDELDVAKPLFTPLAAELPAFLPRSVTTALPLAASIYA